MTEKIWSDEAWEDYRSVPEQEVVFWNDGMTKGGERIISLFLCCVTGICWGIIKAVPGSRGQASKKWDSPEARSSIPTSEINESLTNGNYALSSRTKSATARISSVRVFYELYYSLHATPPFLVQYSEVHPWQVTQTNGYSPSNKFYHNI